MTSSTKYSIDGDANSVKNKLAELIKSEITKSYVKTSWNNLELVIKIEKMGSSEIKLQLTEHDGKCQIHESKRSVAMMHKPFIGEVEKIVDNLFTNKLGAKRL